MKIAILSRGPRLYSTRRLKEACKARGHEVRVLDTMSFSINVEQGNPELLYKNKPLSSYDAVIPRIGASITFFGTAVLRQFEQIGTFCLNSSIGINTSRDKLRSMQLLARHNIGFPQTIFVKQPQSILPAIEELGGAPVVIKLLEGTQGVGVILADSNKIAEAIIETLHSSKQNVLIQKFVSESRGTDIRAIVAGGKVVAAMRRVAQGDDFRSNVHRGGRVEQVNIDERFERTAIRAAQIMGLNVAGVDMLEGKSGPLIMEVNSSPGLEGIERATSIDVAGAMVDCLEEQSLFPEIDLRQRLTMDRGYGVAEIQILKNSDLIGKPVRDAGFREKDVVVMSIKRGTVTISNPRSERELMEEDTLLCFGKLENMKSLISQHRIRKRRKAKKTT
ncbi:MAG: 30S ribosomal protein S6--L-glutamate ligase [Candidatus Omnitrophica bacterium]|nr:30S ribosomal protein S6--L-glutamate ligase [Candidatus Omnitrophota bacterium]MCB9720928.1 30S ribosomal protein S6--L-glutamate ligase [Candidatus Omnitrophota bacterium]